MSCWPFAQTGYWYGTQITCDENSRGSLVDIGLRLYGFGEVLLFTIYRFRFAVIGLRSRVKCLAEGQHRARPLTKDALLSHSGTVAHKKAQKGTKVASHGPQAQ